MRFDGNGVAGVVDGSRSCGLLRTGTNGLGGDCGSPKGVRAMRIEVPDSPDEGRCDCK